MPKLSQLLLRHFPFSPTESQKNFFLNFEQFLQQKIDKKVVFLMKGYAGTGKTTMVSSLVQVLPLLNYKFLLLAPTGRAAKVMSSYSRRKAFTIHKIIYKTEADPNLGTFRFKRARNHHKNTIFLVDEASMLADDLEYGATGLLTDLVGYVHEHPDNKLVLIGDEAQLPPVKKSISPALDPKYLSYRFGVEVYTSELTDVMRQDLNSGILYNATWLRNELLKKHFQIQFKTSRFKDIYRMTGEKMEDGLRYAYNKYGIENTIIVCRSNRQAVNFNHYIRNMIHFYENELEAGDILMIVRNNYFYLPEDSKAGFLANGDFVEVTKIIRFEEMFGFRFAYLQLRLIDYPDEPEFEGRVILDTLHSNAPSLSKEESKKLYQEVSLDYIDVKPQKKQKEAILNDPYLNALQVKYAYALTCHKSQGGQWKAVFVDQGYLKDDMINVDYIRWLYTAITRASDELFLVNFQPTFFE